MPTMRTDWRFMVACFLVLGVGVSALHGLKRVIELPPWAVALALGSFGFVLLGIHKWLARRDAVRAPADQNG
jgi:hypothetical protein